MNAMMDAAYWSTQTLSPFACGRCHSADSSLEFLFLLLILLAVRIKYLFLPCLLL